MFLKQYIEYIKQSLNPDTVEPIVDNNKTALMFSVLPLCIVLIFVCAANTISNIPDWRRVIVDTLDDTVKCQLIPVAVIIICAYLFFALKIRALDAKHKIGISTNVVFRAAAMRVRYHVPFLISAFSLISIMLTLLCFIEMLFPGSSFPEVHDNMSAFENLFMVLLIIYIAVILYLLIKSILIVDRKITFQLSTQFRFQAPVRCRLDNALNRALVNHNAAREPDDTPDRFMDNPNVKSKSWKHVLIGLIPLTLATLCSAILIHYISLGVEDGIGGDILIVTITSIFVTVALLLVVLFPVAFLYFSFKTKQLKKSFEKLDDMIFQIAFRRLLFFEHSSFFVSSFIYYLLLTLIVASISSLLDDSLRIEKDIHLFIGTAWLFGIPLFFVTVFRNLNRKIEKTVNLFKRTETIIVKGIDTLKNQSTIERLSKIFMALSALITVDSILMFFMINKIDKPSGGNESYIFIAGPLLVVATGVIFLAFSISKYKEISIVGKDIRKLPPEEHSRKIAGYSDIDLVRLHDRISDKTHPLIVQTLSGEMIKRGLAENVDFAPGAAFYTAPPGGNNSLKTNIYLTGNFIRFEFFILFKGSIIRNGQIDHVRIVKKLNQFTFSTEKMIQLYYRRKNKLKKTLITSAGIDIWIDALRESGIEIRDTAK
ncbi:MAG TPA: hypothetical protein PLN69_11235 [bacterium]|nr:hypothetical protein [bacterium]